MTNADQYIANNTCLGGACAVAFSSSIFFASRMHPCSLAFRAGCYTRKDIRIFLQTLQVELSFFVIQ